MLILDVPLPATTQVIALGGLTYKIVFNFNHFDDKWRISLYRNTDLVMLNMKVTEQRSLIRSRQTPLDFSHGDLQVHRVKDTLAPCGLLNFGINKEYELRYFTNEELGL